MSRWPTFLVIGAYKSGTTTLHHLFRAHPQVFVPEFREPSYFAFADGPDPTNPTWGRAVREEADYRALFAAAGDATAVGEVSPEYLRTPAAAHSIARRIPDVTLLAVLRNPIDRAFSDWVMYRREGLDKLDFPAALDVQEERRARGEPTGFYLATGHYAEQLSHYVDVFGRERLHVWLYDDVSSDPRAAYAEMFTAIGVDPVVADLPLDWHNVGSVPASAQDRFAYAARARLRPLTSRLPLAGVRRRVSEKLEARMVRPSMDAATRAKLVAHFRPDIERLQRLLDRDLSTWLRTDG